MKMLPVGMCLLACVFNAEEHAEKIPINRGYGVRGGPGFGGRMVALSLQPSVVKEIGLSPRQLKRIRTLRDDYLTAVSGVMREQRGEKTKRRRGVDDLSAKLRSDIQSALKAQQYRRLLQITIQSTGLYSIDAPDISKRLGITKEQRRLIQNSSEMHGQDIAAMYKKYRTNGDFKLLDTSSKKAATASHNRRLRILTEKQRQQLLKMMGKPFTLPLTLKF